MILIIAQFTVLLCTAQRDIVYKFDECVIDSLTKGINSYSTLLRQQANELKLFILLTENRGEYNLYLQEYSYLPDSGLRQTILSSNRKLRISDKHLIPIIYPSDVLSEQVRKDKVAAVPLSGYFLKVVTENYKQRVAEVVILF